MTKWFYTQNGTKHGPVTTSELKSLASSGSLLRTDQVWKEGLKAWKTAGNVIGLFPPLPEVEKITTPPPLSPVLPTRNSSSYQPALPAIPSDNDDKDLSGAMQEQSVSSSKGFIENIEGFFRHIQKTLEDPNHAEKTFALSGVSDPSTQRQDNSTSTPQRITPSSNQFDYRSLLPKGKNSGTGCLIGLIILVLVGWIGQSLHLDGYGVDIQGDTAKVEMIIRHGVPLIDNLSLAASHVATKVYEVAVVNKKVNKIEIKLKMDKQLTQDRYGNAWTEHGEMGTIIVSDLEDVRKFTSAGMYSTDALVRGYFIFEIERMKHSYLLK